MVQTIKQTDDIYVKCNSLHALFISNMPNPTDIHSKKITFWENKWRESTTLLNILVTILLLLCTSQYMNKPYSLNQE